MIGPMPAEPGRLGVRIAGTGMAVPSRTITNADLEKMMDTTDEWIVQRTGIRTRQIIDPARGECTLSLATGALRAALADARMAPDDLDLILLSTISMEMACPPTSCRIVEQVGAGNIPAMDLSAACCGFVYGLNVAYSMFRLGMYRNFALIGADTLSTFMDYDERGRATTILFGDGAGAVIMRATDDPACGMIAQVMHTDATRWHELYIPENLDRDVPEGHPRTPDVLHRLHMNGRAIFKFAVGTFPDVIAETLELAGLTPDQVDHYVCHQSNARILAAARERFGLPEDKLYVNIDRYGNTVAASVPICFHELRAAGRVTDGQLVMFVAFGGGLTWATSLWRI